MGNLRTIVIIVIGAIVVVGVTLFVANQLPPTRPPEVTAAATSQGAAATSQSGQSGVVVPSGLEVSGTFVAPNQATLTFKGSGRIIQISATEGAQVKKGDTLAVLDTTELQLAVTQAKAALAGAQARLDQVKAPTSTDMAAAQAAVDAAQANYDKLKAGANANDVAAAQAAVSAAQANYDKLKAGPSAADLTAAQGALAAAQANYAKVKAGPTANDLAALEAQMANAKAAVNQAQAAYDKVGGASNPNIALTPFATALQVATNNYTAALAAYNNAQTHPTPAELNAALGQVEAAQAALARLTPDAAALSVAASQLQTAQSALTRLTPDAAALSVAASQLQTAQSALARLQPTADNVAVAQAAVDQAQAAYDLAKQQITNATLTAPFDGTVITITPHVGETVSPVTPILLLADLTHLQFQTGVDQVMLEQVQTGESVTIVPDAFKDQPVSGKISRVGQMATTVGGVTTVLVTVDVNPNTVPLRPGLSGSAQIQQQNQ